jgi:hypothetical protein
VNFVSLPCISSHGILNMQLLARKEDLALVYSHLRVYCMLCVFHMLVTKYQNKSILSCII